MPDNQVDIEPFAALNDPAVRALARILFFKRATTTTKTLAACDTWLAGQKRHIFTLRAAAAQSAIYRPGTFSLIADVFFRGDFSKPNELMRAQDAAGFCDAHRDLNPHVLTALMRLVVEESTSHVDPLRAHYERERRSGGKGEGGENPAVEFWLGSMAQMSALWMGKTKWEGRMRQTLPIQLPMLARSRCCMACKLAVVGGSVQFLMDLRTSLEARHRHEQEVTSRRRRPGGPTLLRMVDAWIDVCYGAAKRRLIRRESDALVPMVMALLAGMPGGGVGGRWKERKEEREYTGRGWPVPLLPPAMTEVDVDAYRGVMSDDEEEDEEEEEEEGKEDDGGYVDEDGYVAGRWRRRKRTAKKEGYTQYLPVSVPAAVVVKKMEERHARGGGGAEDLGRQRRPRAASISTIDTTTATINQPRGPPDDVDHARRDMAASVEPPWATVDFDPPAMAAPSAPAPAPAPGPAAMRRTAPSSWPPALPPRRRRVLRDYLPPEAATAAATAAEGAATGTRPFEFSDHYGAHIGRGLESTAASVAAASSVFSEELEEEPRRSSASSVYTTSSNRYDSMRAMTPPPPPPMAPVHGYGGRRGMVSREQESRRQRPPTPALGDRGGPWNSGIPVPRRVVR